MTDNHVLLVEDNPITRKMLRVALSAEGYRVSEAELASEALCALERDRPDLIVLDLVLPDRSGFELLAQLRENPETCDLPVVCVSGFSDDERILAAGFTDHLLKPVDPSAFCERIGLHLRARSSRSHDLPCKVLVVDDDPVQLKFQLAHLRSLGCEVSGARNGFEGLSVAREQHPDVIVSDVMMPGVDGFQLCRAVRLDPDLARVPIVLISSRHLNQVDRELAAKAGATVVLSRTPDLAELVDTVHRLRSTRPHSSQPCQPSLPVEAHRQVMSNLERQAGLDAELSRAHRVWRAMLTLLTRISELPSDPGDVETVLGEALAGLLDAYGFSIGAAYVALGSELVLKAQVGFSPAREPELAGFFGKRRFLQGALEQGEPLALTWQSLSDDAQEILARSQVGSMVLAPLVLGTERLGMIVLASLNGQLPADWSPLAKAAAAPLAQTIVLARVVTRLSSSERRFRSIAESSPDGLVVADEAGAIAYLNPAAERILGTSCDALLGKAVTEYLPLRADGPSIQPRTFAHGEQRFVVEVSRQSFTDDQGERGTVTTLHDLTDRLQLATFRHLANHDPLTGLYNRRRFEEELIPRLAESKRHGCSGSLLLIDLDRFKAINDNLGHLAGDAVLRTVAQVLQTGTRASDIRARLGGDEFLVLLPRTSAEQAMLCAEKILDQLASRPTEFEGRRIAIGASVGIAVFPNHGMSLESLIAAADKALYRAKQAGRNRACIHEREAGDSISAGTLRPELS